MYRRIRRAFCVGCHLVATPLLSCYTGIQTYAQRNVLLFEHCIFFCFIQINKCVAPGSDHLIPKSVTCAAGVEQLFVRENGMTTYCYTSSRSEEREPCNTISFTTSSFILREVPRASTGFTSFELLYVWQVQGPLDILKKPWTKSTADTEERSIVRFILEMRDGLETYRDMRLFGLIKTL
ncbi:hypothetical protein F2P79_011892 [Pimephales promelas]|nr:hypothetical protein F2P79_011892 [Pimephales promelas]